MVQSPQDDEHAVEEEEKQHNDIDRSNEIDMDEVRRHIDMSDAEQDLGSDYGDEDEDHHHKEWSPKQYSVSSNEEEDHMDAEDAIPSPNEMRRDEEVSSEECEETKYERHYKDGDLSVFREIVNEDRNNGGGNYMSDSDDDENHPQQDKLQDYEEEDEDEEDDEEEKENAYNSNLTQMKKDFFERSK